MKRILCCLLWLAPLSLVASPIDHPIIKAFPSSKLFDYQQKRFDKASLVGGDIEYIKGQGEGYKATAEVAVTGRSDVYINDYSAELSSVHIYQEMVKKIQQQEFEVLYTCEDVACGDVSGWQLYLSEQLTGQEQSQYYILAKQNGKDDNQWYVQFYVIDLDDEPRSYFRIVNAQERPDLKIAFNEQMFSEISGDMAVLGNVPSILFKFDRAELSAQAESYLDKLKDAILKRGISRLVVAGHTDNSGPETYNQTLSEQRAHSVVKALNQYKELSHLDIKVEYFGEAKPVASNDTREGRQENRRVSIHYDAPIKTTSLDQ